MFPIAIIIATTAMTFGIGGAAFFSPCFIILFPLVGVPTLTGSEALFAALFTELFGFTSGLIGYIYHGLIDWRTAFIFASVGSPFAMIGAIIALVIPNYVLYILFSTGCLFLCFFVGYNYYISQKLDVVSDIDGFDRNSVFVIYSNDNNNIEKKIDANDDENGTIENQSKPLYTHSELEHLMESILLEYQNDDAKWGKLKFHLIHRLLVDRKKNIYFYSLPLQYIFTTIIFVIFGSLTTGVISVGIGEVTISSLRKYKIPTK